MSRKVTLEINTKHGLTVCDVIRTNEFKQACVYLAPNGGASMFAIYPIDAENKDIEQSLLGVLNGEALEPDLDITDKVKGSILASTIVRPTFALVDNDQ